jgi:hypothetical protein
MQIFNIYVYIYILKHVERTSQESDGWLATRLAYMQTAIHATVRCTNISSNSFFCPDK